MQLVSSTYYINVPKCEIKHECVSRKGICAGRDISAINVSQPLVYCYCELRRKKGAISHALLLHSIEVLFHSFLNVID